MPIKTTPRPKADVDPNLEAQVKGLQKQAAAAVPLALTGGPAKWMMPEKNQWSGDLFDWDGISSPFNADKANQWYGDAVKDPTSPGAGGDLVVTQTAVDYLACLERSFRSRHLMRRPRAFAHAMGRKKGHGHDKGPLVQCVLEFLRGLVKETKS